MSKAVLSEATSPNVYDLVDVMDEDNQEWLPLNASDILSDRPNVYIEPEQASDAVKRLREAEAVYGDTDLSPNQEDQADSHRAEPDEHF